MIIKHSTDRLPCLSRTLPIVFLALVGVLGWTTDGLAATALRIMPIGDSITAGTTDSNWAYPFSFGYRGSLYTRLTNAHYNFTFVGQSPEPWNGAPYGAPPTIVGQDLRAVGQNGHRGYGGSTINDITYGNGYDPGIIADLNADNPNVVLLMIGINDIYYYGNGGNPTDVESRLNNLVQMIVTNKPSVNVIVAQINAYYDGSLTNSVVAYNNYIKNTLVPYYAGQGKHVTTVNQYANFLTPGGAIDTSLYSNIIHPNAAGYDRMAATWFAGIKAVVPEPSSLVLLAILGFALAGRARWHVCTRRG
jgi:lysophospholipase L1-like esterase